MADGGVILIGADPEKSLQSFPSYGLNGAGLGGILKDGGAIVGDRIWVETDTVRGAEIGEALAAVANRKTLLLELYVLDVASNRVDRVNEWLDSMTAGVGYVSSSAPLILNPAGGIGQAIQPQRGLTHDLELKALFQLLELERDIRLELRQQVQILSGSEVQFQAGEVVSTPLIRREPQTGQDLITEIERRTVGLNLTVNATSWSNRWYLKASFSDSSLTGTGQGARERTTKLVADRMIRDTENMFLLASFTRTSRERDLRGVPILAKWKWTKRFSQKSEVNSGSRNFMILARPILSR